MKNNFEDCSSLKFFNFEGWSSQKVIEKYELVLTSREKQITDLSIEIGSINDRISYLSDKCTSLEEENKTLKNKLDKKENILAQELNNKEIMFMRLERKEQECDDLKVKLDKLKASNGKEFPLKLKDVSVTYVNKGENLKSVLQEEFKPNSLPVMTQEQKFESERSKVNTNTNTNDNSNVDPLSQRKPSALDKIRELKERKKNNPSSRINLTGSIIENNSVSQSDNTGNNESNQKEDLTDSGIKIIDNDDENSSKRLNQESNNISG